MTARDPVDSMDIEEMGRAARMLTTNVARATREHPYIALATAAGVGFVLAGGLRSRMGKAMLAVAARLALPQLETAVMSVVSRLQDESEPETASADMAKV